MTNEHATNELVEILLGASMDSLRIYSVVLQIGFMKTNPEDGALDQVWLNVNGGLQVDDFRTDENSISAKAMRAQVVGALTLLFGESVSQVHVDDRGQLTIAAGRHTIKAYSEGDDMEEVWTVFTGSSARYEFHEHYVGLDDTGGVVVRREPRPSQ